ncbi:MAG: succinate dehydrogenase, cytochrome b556 subunit [Legionella sp.]|nr:succinate dehydrogenase, cytochrome b556 subunit [Legionella sp.]
MKQERPINLDLSTFKYPPMAIASILHRISGCMLFLLMPVMLYFLSLSLHNADSFLNLRSMFHHPFPKLLLWGFTAALLYHLLAGTRHLVMNLGWGESLAAGRASAMFVMAATAVGIILLGIWIW